MSGALVLTGASGFVGQAMAVELLDRGWQVIGIARDPARAARGADKRIGWFAGDLAAGFDSAAWAGASVLVHAGWASDPARPEVAADHNVRGAQRLFQAAADAGLARRVFISSMSSHPRAQSHYGRSKLEVEALLDLGRDLVIRPGFVLGAGGVHQRLTESIRKLPFLPSFYGGQQPIQTIHVDDLVKGIANAIEANLVGRMTLASPEVLTMDAFYRAIAAAEGQPRKPTLRLPGDLACTALQALERLGLRLPMTSENLLGLKALEKSDVRDDLSRVQLAPKRCADVLGTLAGRGGQH